MRFMGKMGAGAILLLALSASLHLGGWSIPAHAGHPPVAGAGPQVQQTLILPRRPPRPHVRWLDIQWQIMAIPIGDGAHLMLHYPESARKTASRAARIILQNLRELERAFDYRPRQSFMYVLYGSEAQFHQTHLFPVGIGTLGVTDIQRLDVALFYTGDHRNFERVSLHELTHQFTIQLVNDVSQQHDASWNPLFEIPLWFIEGMAEYHAFRGVLDAETHAHLRDLVRYPNPYQGNWLRSLFAPDIYSYVQIYRVGHAKVQFLAETYGEDLLRGILNETYRLVPTGMEGFVLDEVDIPVGELSFDQMVALLTGESVEVMDERWVNWAHRTFGCAEIPAQGEEHKFQHRRGPMTLTDRFQVDPSGRFVLYRSIDHHTGVTSLDLVMLERPGESPLRVTEDDRPGVSSLNPFGPRNFTIGSTLIAYAGRHRGKDLLEVRPLVQEDAGRSGPPTVRVGERVRRYSPVNKGVLQINNPTLSTDEKRLAFIGLDQRGQLDLWMLNLESGSFRRLTDSPHTKRDLSWGEPGLLFSSDSTPDGTFDIFMIPDSELHGDGLAQQQALTQVEGRDLLAPDFLGEGEVLFSSTTIQGSSQVWSLRSGPGAPGEEPAPPWLAPERGEIVPVTAHPLGIWEPQPRNRGGELLLFGRAIRNGYNSLSIISRSDLSPQALPEPAFSKEERDAWVVPDEPVDKMSVPYSPWNLRAWSVDQFMLAASTGYFGFGQLAAADRMRDRLVLMQAAGYGSLDLIDANILYFDRSRRTNWGAEIYHLVVQRRDRDTDSPFFTGQYFLEKQFGLRGLLAFPFSDFTQLTASMATEGRYRSAPIGLAQEEADQWERQFGGPFPTVVAGLHLGYNALRYQFDTGPVSGRSLDLRTSTAFPLTRGTEEMETTAGFDAHQYFRIASRSSIGFRIAGGSNFSQRFTRDFYITSWDNLRGLTFDDPGLRGDHYLVSNFELKFPLNEVVAMAFINDFEGILGLDAGSVFTRRANAWDNRTLAAVTGANARFGAIIFRLHFGYPINIGGYFPGSGWVTQFSLRYLMW